MEKAGGIKLHNLRCILKHCCRYHVKQERPCQALCGEVVTPVAVFLWQTSTYF